MGLFMSFPSFLKLSLIVMNMQIYNLHLICISDDVIKGRYLNFNLVPNLVVYVKKQLIHTLTLFSHMQKSGFLITRLI